MVLGAKDEEEAHSAFDKLYSLVVAYQIRRRPEEEMAALEMYRAVKMSNDCKPLYAKEREVDAKEYKPAGGDMNGSWLLRL